MWLQTARYLAGGRQRRSQPALGIGDVVEVVLCLVPTRELSKSIPYLFGDAIRMVV